MTHPPSQRHGTTSLLGVAIFFATCISVTPSTVVEAESIGTLTGKVSLAGPAPSPPPPGHVKPIERKACGTYVTDGSIVVGKEATLKNVIVYLQGVTNPRRTKGKIRLTNRECRYEPRVQTATVGSTLIVGNEDDILHNTHAYLGESRTLFNLALPFKGLQIPRPLREPGMVRFTCDAGHTWMRGYLLVLEHDFHTVTDENGRFRIEAVPPDAYTLKVWHERLGTKAVNVSVKAGAENFVEILWTRE